MTDGPAAGWYPDPLRRFDHRYWDGSAWTHHVSRGGEAAVDEAPGATSRTWTSTAEGTGTTEDQPARSHLSATTADDSTSVTEASPAADAPDPAGPGAAPSNGGTSSASADAAAGPATSFAAVGATPGRTAQGAAEPASTGTRGHAAPASRSPAAGSTTWQPTARTAITNTKAVASLIASIVWLGGLASIAGIVLGLMGRREVERSEGRETGAGIALAGIVIGALGILTTIAVAGVVALVMRALDEGGPPDTFVPDSTLDGSGQDAEGDLSFSLVDVAFHQDLVLEEHGRYAETVEELLRTGWIVSQTVDVQVFADGADAWCVQAVSELDPTLVWATSSEDPDGPGAGSC